MNLENFKPLKQYETEREYPEGSLIYWHSLGEESYGLIIATPDGEYHTEEIPQYGGDPRYYKQVYSLQEALDVVKGFV